MAKKLPIEQEVQIDALSKDGLGAAILNERPLWVRNALPGERVQARILKRRGGQRYADGQPLSDLSRNRVTSACQHFPRCAGCNLHHLAYNEQLQLKQGHSLKSCNGSVLQPQAGARPRDSRAWVIGVRRGLASALLANRFWWVFVNLLVIA